MNNHNHRVSSIENPGMYVPIRHPSTTVENPLQIDLFMQNKPNFRKSQMNANTFTQMAYKNKSNWTIGQNKPNFVKGPK